MLIIIQRCLTGHLKPCLVNRTVMLFSPAVTSPPTLSARHLSYCHRRSHLPLVVSSSPNSHRSLSVQTSPVVPMPIPHVDPKKIEERNIGSLSTLGVLSKKLEQVGIEISPCTPGQHDHMLCPQCNGGTSTELSLSVSITADGNTALFKCFRAKCGWEGGIKAFADSKSTYGKMINTPKVKKLRTIKEEDLEFQPLCVELLAYFAERMISRETLKRNNVMQRRYGDQIAIAFPYRRDKILVSCKYRDINKIFWQEADCEKIFYGLDDIKGKSDIIIVEGEMDKLALEEAGFRNCVSVPDGAPPSVSTKDLPSEEQDTKYQYLWNCKEYLAKASRIILATDGDTPGQALAEELARRVGRERCWRVKWPKKNDVSNCKDANEVLMFMGPVMLKEVIENAELYPIKGLFNFKDYFDEIDSYYNRTLGVDVGVSTGWTALNPFYNIVPGELTIVTGVPNSGKSEWIDALLCNLNRSSGWKFALCSMENRVREHARKLLEKHIRKPFFNTRYGESLERMSADELQEGKEWLNDTFHLIRCENDCLPSIDWLLDLAKAAVLRHGVNGLVIDPYNELDHQRGISITIIGVGSTKCRFGNNIAKQILKVTGIPSVGTETEYVSQMLTKVKRFAQHHSCHVWFVAHPKQLQHWDGKPPSLYDISGSAHFINKCDNGIVIHRNRNPEAGPLDQVQVCVRKVRNKVVGTIGDAFLSYDRVTGEYKDMEYINVSVLNETHKKRSR